MNLTFKIAMLCLRLFSSRVDRLSLELPYDIDALFTFSIRSCGSPVPGVAV